MHVMGIDLGTGGARAIVMRVQDGRILGQGSAPMELLHPQAAWSEQRPDDWWQAACTAISAALHDADLSGSDIKAVALTGQMHGCTLVDAADQPVRNALLWNDQRTTAQCESLSRALPRDTWIASAGKPPLTGLTLPSLCWVRDNEPDTFARATGFLLPKDFLRLRLTGERATDVGDASGTMLLDLKSRSWSDALCAAGDIDLTLLPNVYEGPNTTGMVHAAAAQATGLAEGTPVIAGGGDQQAGAIGCGVVAPGTVSLNLGTSGVLFAATEAPPSLPPKGLHAFCHSVPDTWHVMGVMLSAGGALRWWRDICGSDYDTLVSEALDSEGVRFTPYLAGERTPHEDATLTAGFSGLQLHHDRRHMTRAVLEGIAFGLRDGLELIRTVQPVDHLRLTGGAADSPVWRQLIADVTGCTVATINVSEGSAFGACLLAASGAGCFSSVQTACGTLVDETSRTEPTCSMDADWASWRDHQANTGSASRATT